MIQWYTLMAQTIYFFMQVLAQGLMYISTKNVKKKLVQAFSYSAVMVHLGSLEFLRITNLLLFTSAAAAAAAATAASSSSFCGLLKSRCHWSVPFPITIMLVKISTYRFIV